ncbi:uncharacterized protein EI97DRAFT_456454 [Westerdykella ornata]|uniref:Uncharacterized protein n=1 Tax=Westerdykella ornata TaxID=318751 RepID=A0A6A6JVH4_WESOR|nr:uncharacterized protein EI97DRAFT_456454 [Westerdykella ornata]KAF2279049.1 hypothetical protein EI97DRAFT_456454 [Westerdykella ornata]
MGSHRPHGSRKSLSTVLDGGKGQRRPNLPTLLSYTLHQYPFDRRGSGTAGLSGRGTRISPTSARSLGPLPRIQRTAARTPSVECEALPPALRGVANIAHETREGAHPLATIGGVTGRFARSPRRTRVFVAPREGKSNGDFDADEETSSSSDESTHSRTFYLPPKQLEGFMNGKHPNPRDRPPRAGRLQINLNMERATEREGSTDSEGFASKIMDTWIEILSIPGELQRGVARAAQEDAEEAAAAAAAAASVAEADIDMMELSEQSQLDDPSSAEQPTQAEQPDLTHQLDPQENTTEATTLDETTTSNGQQQDQTADSTAQQQNDATQTAAEEQHDITQLIQKYSNAYQALSTVIRAAEAAIQTGGSTPADAMIDHSAVTSTHGLQVTILFDSRRRPLITAEAQSAIWVILRSKQRSWTINPIGIMPVQIVRATRNVRSAWVQARNDLAKILRELPD